jgi:hypothetical protein
MGHTPRPTSVKSFSLRRRFGGPPMDDPPILKARHFIDLQLCTVLGF